MTTLQPTNRILSVLSILCFSILISCSDDGGESSQLVASAGDDRNVLVGQKVTLNGNGSSDSEGKPFEFNWEFIVKPSSSNADFLDNSSDMPEFTPDVGGKYKIELTVSNTSQSFDTVTVAAFSVKDIDGNYDNLFPGPDVGIRDFATACGCLIATCEFTEIGGIKANKIACFNGTKWSALGCGLEDGSIYDIIEYKGELYVIGEFDEIGCIPAKNIARWNCETNTWRDVKEGLQGGDEPFGNTLEIFEGELYAGGRFNQAGTASVGNIAKWDGTNWSSVGSFENGSVRSLKVYKQKLYAGGFFDGINGSDSRRIAAYDGSNWNALGSLEGLELKSTGAVKHMAVLNEVLYISGEFSSNNDDISELITWNGSQFNDFGRAFSSFRNSIDELAVINDVLYIGGEFQNVVASQANNILQWDGENWGVMGQGTLGAVLAIEYYNNQLFVGGDFGQAGGQAAENISIWSEN